MKRYFAYIRVSTVKQGEKGSSLQEQRSAIEVYARRHNLAVVEWFEEKQTAAKQGRVVFSRMLKALAKQSVSGVIIHKIDRSARNLRDWATLGDLIDSGVELHFAHESIDLSSRGGRLSADIQAVVAADFIRNLRQETRKGLYGRLKQGLYPLRAPIGYLDQGRAQAKIPDPTKAHLIRSAFELYSTGAWSLDTLGEELYSRGLRNRSGSRVSRNGLSTLLNNPFYIGLMQIKKVGETFSGVHQPLVAKSVFDDVQRVLRGWPTHRRRSREYLYQRTIRCAFCNRSLIPELQKGRIYYRCHSRECPTTSIREDCISDFLRGLSARFRLSAEEWAALNHDLSELLSDKNKRQEHERQTLSLSIASIGDRLTRLTDAFVDQLIDRESYLDRKARLLSDRAQLTSRKAEIDSGIDHFSREVQKRIELLKTLGNMPDLDNPLEMRELLKRTTSNFLARGKYLEIAWAPAFQSIVECDGVSSGDLNRDGHRTFEPPSRTSIIVEQLRLLTEKPAEDAARPSEDGGL